MLRPMNDNILIKVDEESEVTAGGIIKPDDATESIQGTAVVVAVGPGKWTEPKKKGVQPKRIPVGVEVGDGVVFIKYLAKTRTNEQLRQWHLQERQLLIKPGDVLLAYDRDNPPRFD